jgi:hypothetical protein
MLGTGTLRKEHRRFLKIRFCGADMAPRRRKRRK